MIVRHLDIPAASPRLAPPMPGPASISVANTSTSSCPLLPLRPVCRRVPVKNDLIGNSQTAASCMHKPCFLLPLISAWAHPDCEAGSMEMTYARQVHTQR
jgi:hypothetical protein